MCVKIINNGLVTKYDVGKPLEVQLLNSDRVVINYEPADADINTFVREMKRIAVKGISTTVNLEISHNNHLKGIKTKKQLNRLVKNIEVNEAIKLLVTLQSNTEKALEEMANFCKRT